MKKMRKIRKIPSIGVYKYFLPSLSSILLLQYYLYLKRKLNDSVYITPKSSCSCMFYLIITAHPIALRYVDKAHGGCCTQKKSSNVFEVIKPTEFLLQKKLISVSFVKCITESKKLLI
jgi:hypothetical protein